MRTKIYLSFAFLFLGVFIINAQDNYYYYKGDKVPLTLDKGSVRVSVFNNLRKSSLSNLNFKKINLKESNNTNQSIRYGTIEYQSTPSDLEYAQKMKALKKLENIRTVSPNFITENGEKIGMSDYFYVKLKKAGDFEKLKQLADQKGTKIIEQNEFMPLWYTLRCTENTKGNTLQTANYFFETGLFSSSSPDLFAEDDLFAEEEPLVAKQSSAPRYAQQWESKASSPQLAPCANDPLFNGQWSLRNTNNEDLDINACDAWQITEGRGVTVAVFSSGVELTHIDLAANISPLSYDVETGSSPSQYYVVHGTVNAGIIGAVKDNNLLIAGIAPESTIMSISFRGPNQDSDFLMKRANGINWAWQHGADVINNPWGLLTEFDAIDDAINNALIRGRDGKGTVVVFPTAGGNNNEIVYPANSNPYIISVGALDTTGLRFYSRYGNELDVVAPGHVITSLGQNNGITTGNSGSSMAGSFVSGVAALILSVNPSLGVYEVNSIIEKTAQKISPDTYAYANHLSRPNGTWNEEVGYGLVDAYAAAQMALSALDLYIKDSSDDIGEESNETTLEITNSPDIWIRNNPDGIHQDQDPLYQHPDQYHPDRNKPSYVYFNVRNRGSITTLGNERLILYWSKTSSGLSWPEDWNGTSVYENGHVKGDPIRSITIPALEPGEETTLFIPWRVPYQGFYEGVDPSPSKYTLLARLESTADPMATEETSDVRLNARNNNNIALKSVTAKPRTDLYIKDSENDLGVEPNLMDVRFWHSQDIWVRNNADNGLGHQNPIYGDANNPNYVYVKVRNRGDVASSANDQVKLYWRKNGRPDRWPSNYNGTLYNDGVLMGAPIGALSIPVLAPQEEVNLHIPWLVPNLNDYTGFSTHNWGFSILVRIVSDTDPMTDEKEMIYTTHNVRNNNNIARRSIMVVDAVSDSKKRKNIKEFIANTTSSNNDKRISADRSYLDKIIPNPVTGTARITYNLGGAKSAYLMVVGFYDGATNKSNNYILEAGSQDTTIQMDNYLDGYYKVALICDGKVIDVKTLIKQ